MPEQKEDFIDEIIQLTAYYDKQGNVRGRNIMFGTKEFIRKKIKKILFKKVLKLWQT